MSFSILGTGSAFGSRVITNGDFEKMLDTSDEWIRTRTGIRERHTLAEGESLTQLACKAASGALEMAGLTPQDLDYIICATVTADYKTPAQACVIQKELGATCPAFDINAGCSGFVYALNVANGFFAVNPDIKVLVIGADAITHFHVRTEMVHGQQVEVEAFVLHMVGVFNQMPEQEEGCLVCDVPSDVVVGGIVPLAVQGLEHAANLIVPPLGKVIAVEIFKIHEISVLLVGERATPYPVINIPQQADADLVLKVELPPFILAGTAEHAPDASLPIKSESGKTRTKVHLAPPIHVIIKARRPAKTDMRSETDVSFLHRP